MVKGKQMANLRLLGQRSLKLARSILHPVLLTSLTVTLVLLGVRQLRILEPLELRVFDQLIRWRADEGPDPRLLVVAITEDDIEALDQWPPTDETIDQLLDILEGYHPYAIGLDIYRDLRLEPGHDALTARLAKRDRIVAICKRSDAIGSASAVRPPNVLRDRQGAEDRRVGFSDLIIDPDGIVRRSLLAVNAPGEKCQTLFSFNLQLAFQYLAAKGIHPEDSEVLQLGNTAFHRLPASAGSYQQADTRGYQILLNYRSPSTVAQQVTLSDVLIGNIDPKLVKNRLVLIGATAPSLGDDFYTPYSAGEKEIRRMPGVIIHAQTVSQILSAVLDGRPLFWFWPDWGEGLWILAWSLAGGLAAGWIRHPLGLGAIWVGEFATLFAICVGLLVLEAGWVPLLPAAIALFLTGGSVAAYKSYKTLREQQEIIQRAEEQKETIALLQTLLQTNQTSASQPTQLSEATLAARTHLPEAKTTRQQLPGEAITASFEEEGILPGELVNVEVDFRLAGRYKVLEPLALGGFGQTYLAEDVQRPGNPTCVVKHLLPARSDNSFLQVARRLFTTEAEILERLGQHSQIPQLLAYFEENDEFYLVEEFIEGHPLNEELPVDRRMPESRILDLLKGILPVLAFIHKHHVIHRDIKPNNIIRRKQDSRLVMIDFGAVKQISPKGTRENESFTVAIGTKGYAPPEQFVGQPRLSSDIYALGMIGVQAVTGIFPSDLPQNPETGTVDWQKFASVSDGFARILNQMICYHFSDRYKSAAEVLKDLKSLPVLPGDMLEEEEEPTLEKPEKTGEQHQDEEQQSKGEDRAKSAGMHQNRGPTTKGGIKKDGRHSDGKKP